MEGVFAFFAESAFLGIFVSGWGRVRPRLHWASAVMVFVGSWLSGFFIIATNAWMQHPVAYSGTGGRVQLESFWGPLTNPWLGWQYTHNMGGAAITGAFAVAGLGAFYLLLGRHQAIARMCVKAGVIGPARNQPALLRRRAFLPCGSIVLPPEPKPGEQACDERS